MGKTFSSRALCGKGSDSVFTGIIEEIGSIRKITRDRSSGSLTIGAREIMSDVKIGDSIAVNGICLTVTGCGEDSFTADAMHETFDRSCIGSFRAGTRVNLERAMPAQGRFGGHIVAGHIDGTGKIRKIYRDENAVWYEITAPEQIRRYIVEKGSVAIDGISLTVARTGRDSFSVSVIPHTEIVTTMGDRREGDMVNVETDCIGKYVEKLLAGRSVDSHVTKELLLQNGFL